MNGWMDGERGNKMGTDGQSEKAGQAIMEDRAKCASPLSGSTIPWS